ncbi:MAG TPA: hypothetical protein VI383_12255 [Gemmatimonadales bacterium]|nr:hypothetical protein [Gemmatimonadales bacterium]
MPHLLVTIDTEEDEWGQFSAPRFGARNIRRIPELQELFDRFGVTPTYLVTHQVANNEEAVRILEPIASAGRCEIGAHCHPWNTPPFRWPSDETHSMLHRLPPEAQFEKIRALKETLRMNLGQTPVSFRAGRFGFDDSVAVNLLRLGFRVDTSVTPLLSWTEFGGPEYDEDYPDCFWLRFGAEAPGRLLEVPCTVGFLQRSPVRANARLQSVRASPLLHRLRAQGVLEFLGIINKVWLCPEKTPLADMVALSRRRVRDDAAILNLMFHSVSLEPGLTPFVRDERDRRDLLGRIRRYLEFCRSRGVLSRRLDAVSVLTDELTPPRPLHTVALP